MYEEKQAVLKITASKSRTGIKAEFRKKVLETKDTYKVSSNTFFKFIFEEVEKLRGEK